MFVGVAVEVDAATSALVVRTEEIVLPPVTLIIVVVTFDVWLETEKLVVETTT